MTNFSGFRECVLSESLLAGFFVHITLMVALRSNQKLFLHLKHDIISKF